jgi:hypothetical protein
MADKIEYSIVYFSLLDIVGKFIPPDNDFAMVPKSFEPIENIYISFPIFFGKK